jgi:hypothetical protein
MNCYDPFEMHESEDVDTLYCSATQNPNEIIWAGSDTEENPHEIHKKRLRYENHARSYLHGQIPVLQSASLRGPLDRDWVNPWRYRPAEPDWWQPGSGDMLFTRADVMKRAADHGFGHMTAAEALSWCKAEAKKEAKARGVFLGDTSTCSGDESDRGSETGKRLNVMELLSPKTHHIPRSHSDTASTYNRRHPSLVVEPHKRSRMATVDKPSHSGKGVNKRLAGSQWLKGSYVSKRARWDSPGAPSPTPAFDLQITKEQRRYQGSMNLPMSKILQNYETLHPAPSRLHKPYKMEPAWSSDEARIEHRGGGAKGKDEDSWETIYGTAVNSIARSRAAQSPLNIANGADLGTELRNRTSSSSRPPFTTPFSFNKRPDVYSTGSGLNQFPKLPRDLRSGADGEMDSMEDISFITEIAPSTRDLEKFEFRKKRKISEHQHPHPSNSGPEDRGPHVVTTNSSTKSTASGRRTLSNSRLSNDEDFSALKPRKDFTVSESSATSDLLQPISSPNDSLLVSPNHSSPTSCQANISWDMVEDSISYLCLKQNSTTDTHANKAQVNRSPSRSEPSTEDQAYHSGPNTTDRRNSQSTEIDKPMISFTRNLHFTDLAVTCFPKSSAESSLRGSQDSRQSLKSNTTPQIESLAKRVESEELPVEKVLEVHTKSSIPDDGSTQSYSTTVKGSFICADGQRPHDDDIFLKVQTQTPKKGTELVERSVQNTNHYKKAPSTEDLYSPNRELQDQTELKTLIVANKANVYQETSKVHKTNENCTALCVEQPLRGDVEDEMQIIRGQLSQNCPLDSQHNHKSEGNHSSQESYDGEDIRVEINHALDPPEMNNQTPILDLEQESRHEYSTQSPWGIGNSELVPSVLSNNQDDRAPLTSQIQKVSSYLLLDRKDVKMHFLERLAILDHDGITPFKESMSPTPSPEPACIYSNQNDLPSTQLLVEAATNNPWTCNSKSPVSKRSKKRVSFGLLPSEAKQNTHSGVPHFLNNSRTSPSPKIKAFHIEEDFNDDDTTTVNNLGNHLIAKSSINQIYPDCNNSPLQKSSPAVEGMAEAFIAADRETSAECERRRMSTPSRYLKPVSSGMVNIDSTDKQASPLTGVNPISSKSNVSNHSKTVDYEASSGFNDFLENAEAFLEEWSVETELKKSSEAKVRSHDSREEVYWR